MKSIPDLKPESQWLVVVECLLQVVRISPDCRGFFIPGEDPCWGFSHVAEWIAEIDVDKLSSAYDAKSFVYPMSAVKINVTADQLGKVEPKSIIDKVGDEHLLHSLPLFVWLGVLQAPPWIIHAALTVTAVHVEITEARLRHHEAVINLAFVSNLVGRILLEENDRLRRDLNDIDLLGLRTLTSTKP